MQIIDPLEAYGRARPGNDALFSPREELLGGRLWRELSAKHGWTDADFDWLVAHCRAQREALRGVRGFRARTRIMGEYLARLMDRFGADPRAAGAEWRSLNEPTLEGAMERRHDDARLNDARFVESIVDSVMPAAIAVR